MYQWQAKSAASRLSSRADFVRVSEGVAASLRQFSISARAAAEENNKPGFRKFNLFSKNDDLADPSYKSNVTTSPVTSSPRTGGTGPSRGGNKPVDGRSLSAGGTGQRLSRPPGLLLRGNIRRGALGGARGGGMRGGMSRGAPRGAPRGGAARARGPDGAARRRIVRAAAGGQEDDGKMPPELAAYERSVIEANRPEPVAYTPEIMTKEILAEDWPGLPIANSDPESAARLVEQKLAYLSNRKAHEYEPAEYLAERFWDGEMIAFKSEEEKKEVMEIVNEKTEEFSKMILAAKPDKDPKPRYKEFETMNADTQRKMLNSLLAGAYAPPAKTKKEDQPADTPLITELMKNLTNNSTWDSASTKIFMDKIQSMVPTKAQGMGRGRRPATARP